MARDDPHAEARRLLREHLAEYRRELKGQQAAAREQAKQAKRKAKRGLKAIAMWMALQELEEHVPELASVANLTFPVQQAAAGQLRLRRVDEATLIKTKAELAELVNECWPKARKLLSPKARAAGLISPTRLFQVIGEQHGIDPQVLWRAWRQFVFAEDKDRVAWPLDAEWALRPPNADSFEVARVDGPPKGLLLAFEPYAAQLVGLEPVVLIGKRLDQVPELVNDILSDDLAGLGRLMRSEEEVHMVSRVSGTRSVLVLATMQLLDAERRWRILWQVLDERELDSAVELARRLNHLARAREDTPSSEAMRYRDSDSRPEMKGPIYYRDSALRLLPSDAGRHGAARERFA